MGCLRNLALVEGLDLEGFYRPLGYPVLTNVMVDRWCEKMLQDDPILSQWCKQHESLIVTSKPPVLHIAAAWPHDIGRYCDELLLLLQSKDPTIAYVLTHYTKVNLRKIHTKICHQHLHHQELLRPFMASTLATGNKISHDQGPNLLPLYPSSNGNIVPDEGVHDQRIQTYIQHLLNHSVLHQATDLHWLPQLHWVQASMRCGGHLYPLPPPIPKSWWSQLVGYLKVQGAIDIAQDHRPQTGLWSLNLAGQPYNCRISCHPTIHGTSIAIRLLPQIALTYSLADLGFSSIDCAHINRALDKTQGIILVAGPTGSGKTTTLYTMIRRFLGWGNKTPHHGDLRNVLTLEDPVEYHLHNLRQTSVNDAAMGYEEGLTSVLRHDPDVIIVGEIRTPQTAQLVLQASRTGHLVLATIHGNNPQGALKRLAQLAGQHLEDDIKEEVELCLYQELMNQDCGPNSGDSHQHGINDSSCVSTGLAKRSLKVMIYTKTK